MGQSKQRKSSRARRRKKKPVTGRTHRVNMGGKGPRVGGDELGEAVGGLAGQRT